MSEKTSICQCAANKRVSSTANWVSRGMSEWNSPDSLLAPCEPLVPLVLGCVAAVRVVSKSRESADACLRCQMDLCAGAPGTVPPGCKVSVNARTNEDCSPLLVRSNLASAVALCGVPEEEPEAPKWAESVSREAFFLLRFWAFLFRFADPAE